MKRLTAIVLFAVANLALAGNSFAQSYGVKATVPFDFTMNNKLMPPGTYTITKQSNVIIVKNQDKPVSALGLVTNGDDHGARGEKLVFNKYGDQYFLSRVVSESAGMNLQVPSSKTEKRAKGQLEASNAGSSQILVATKR